jgi:hypothetical protein
MSPIRLLVLAVALAAVATPLASVAAPAGDATTACAAKPMTLTERRISEEAAKGMPALISFVNLSQPIYQLRLDDAVAVLDGQRDRRNACISASARTVPY